MGNKNRYTKFFMLTFCRYMRINIFIRHRAHPDAQQRARLKGGLKMKLTPTEKSRIRSFWHIFGATPSEIKTVCRMVVADRVRS